MTTELLLLPEFRVIINAAKQLAVSLGRCSIDCELFVAGTWAMLPTASLSSVSEALQAPY